MKTLTAQDVVDRLVFKLSVRELWRLVREGRFPAPNIRISVKRAYWFEADLVAKGLIIYVSPDAYRGVVTGSDVPELMA